MGPTNQNSTQSQQEEAEDEASIQETTATAEIGINSKFDYLQRTILPQL
jgi:hypothetical protein